MPHEGPVRPQDGVVACWEDLNMCREGVVIRREGLNMCREGVVIPRGVPKCYRGA